MENSNNNWRMPRIGDQAPEFRAMTTKGKLNFPGDYKGYWKILFSHPADFTPVCTTEFIAFAKMQEEFDKLNTKLVGLSVDSLSSHIAWVRNIKEKIDYLKEIGIVDVILLNPKNLMQSVDLIYARYRFLTEDVGLRIVANIVMIGAIVKVTEVVSVDAAKQAILDSVPKGTEDKNIQAFEAGYALL